MTQPEHSYDIIIIGGGPAGATAAIYARRAGLRTLLLEKEYFPRDKICGDAISGKSMTILKDLNLIEEAKNLPGALIDAIVFGSPDHKEVRIPLKGNPDKGIPPGLVIRRSIFDNFLFEAAQREGGTTIQGFRVTGLIMKNNQVAGVEGKDDQGKKHTYHGKIIFGADGFSSVVARKMQIYNHDPRHWVVALRQYYRNVSGVDNKIELHYINEVQPGYLWIFAADDDKVNVGIGMHQQALKRRNVDLKIALKKALDSPAFKSRFKNAEALEEPRGWNLPVGSMRRKNFGNGFLLLGDAAGLIDPFSGEGIGNAMYSARYAVEAAKAAIESGDLSAAFLARYDRDLWNEIGDELKVSSKLQKIGQIRPLLKFVLNKAARSDNVREIISGMMANQIPKQKLANPLFYLKLIFS